MSLKYKLLNTFRSSNEKETFQIAKKIAKKFSGGEIAVLFGPIGAGKTVFASGLVAGIGCKKRPISSSFNLARVYEGKKLKIAHFDLFRLDSPKDLDFEFEDYLSKDFILVVEWPLPASGIYSRFSHYKVCISLKGEDRREIKIYEA